MEYFTYISSIMDISTLVPELLSCMFFILKNEYGFFLLKKEGFLKLVMYERKIGIPEITYSINNIFPL